MTTNEVYLTTAQLAARRGITRQAIAAAVKRESLTPAITLANGYFLFDPADVEDYDKAPRK